MTNTPSPKSATRRASSALTFAPERDEARAAIPACEKTIVRLEAPVNS